MCLFVPSRLAVLTTGRSSPTNSTSCIGAGGHGTRISAKPRPGEATVLIRSLALRTLNGNLKQSSQIVLLPNVAYTTTLGQTTKWDDVYALAYFSCIQLSFCSQLRSTTMSNDGVSPSQSQQQQRALLQQLNPEQQAAFHLMSTQQKLAVLQRLSQQQQQAQTQEIMYRVFRPEMDSVADDPLDPGKRYHDGVFVETDQIRTTGTMFHVTGDVIAASGMRYEEKDNYCPEQSKRLHRTIQIGCVAKADHDSGRISIVLQALPTPSKQQGLNFWERNAVTKRHDIIWTKENGDPYGPGEERRRTFKCNEWTSLYAIPALRNAGILRNSG